MPEGSDPSQLPGLPGHLTPTDFPRHSTSYERPPQERLRSPRPTQRSSHFQFGHRVPPHSRPLPHVDGNAREAADRSFVAATNPRWSKGFDHLCHAFVAYAKSLQCVGSPTLESCPQKVVHDSSLRYESPTASAVKRRAGANITWGIPGKSMNAEQLDGPYSLAQNRHSLIGLGWFALPKVFHSFYFLPVTHNLY